MKRFWAAFWGIIILGMLFSVWGLVWSNAKDQPMTVRAQAQVNTLCTAQLDPPVPGVRLCWQNRCWTTDTQGGWKHGITVVAGQWYEFVLESGGPIRFIGIQGPNNAVVRLVSDQRAGFKFISRPETTSGVFILFVVSEIPTATMHPSPTAIPTETPMPPTPGPSPTVTIQEPPTPDWPPVPHPPATLDPNERLPWNLLRLIEQRSYEIAHTNPPDLFAVCDDVLYLAAITHNGTAGLWAWGHDPEGRAHWRIPAGRLATGIFWVEYDGDRVRCLAFENMIAVQVESSGRIFILQYGGYILAEVCPGTAWEVIP